MSKTHVDRLEYEADQVRQEYARRDREIPRDRYSWKNPGNLLAHAQICRAVIAALDRHELYPPLQQRMLDVGCGQGRWLLEFLQWGAQPRNVAGLDLLPDRVDFAHRRLPTADIRLGNAGDLPWPDGSFDIVTQFVVLSSVFDAAVQERIAAEMMRVTRPGGLILSVDFVFSNPWNPSVRGVSVPRLRNLFRGWTVSTQSLLIPPQLLRSLGRYSWTGVMLLESLPFLRTHCVAAISRNPPKADQ